MKQKRNEKSTTIQQSIEWKPEKKYKFVNDDSLTPKRSFWCQLKSQIDHVDDRLVSSWLSGRLFALKILYRIVCGAVRNICLALKFTINIFNSFSAFRIRIVLLLKIKTNERKILNDRNLTLFSSEYEYSY